MCPGEIVAGRPPQERREHRQKTEGGRSEYPRPRRAAGRERRRLRYRRGDRNGIAQIGLEARGETIEARDDEAAQVDRLLLDRGLDAPAPILRRMRTRRGYYGHVLVVAGLGSDFDRHERGLGQIAAVREQMKLVQHLRDVHGPYLFGQHTHRAQRTRLADVQLSLLGGVHHDWNHGGLGVALDRLHGLQAIHSRHEMVHEYGIGPIVPQIFDGLFGRFGHVDFDVVLLEHPAQDHASRLRVVND